MNNHDIPTPEILSHLKAVLETLHRIEEILRGKEGTFVEPMPAHEAAAEIIAKLPPELINYAASPERGEHMGFAALHDHMDANMLLPQAETLPCHVTSEAEENYVTAFTEWASKVTEEVTRQILGR